MLFIREVSARVRAIAVRAVRAVGRWWRSHRERMAAEAGYGEAFIAVVFAVTELITDSNRVRYLIDALAAAYVAVLRVLSPQGTWEEITDN